MSERVKIWTDGACSGNPGPGGWGSLMRFGDHEKELSGGAEDTTNNRMELQAAIESLKALKKKLTYTEVPVRYKKRIGISKVSGTLKGSIFAGIKILSWIFKYSIK